MLLRQITDEIMFELRELSGQTYVNQYCKRKSEDAAAPTEAAHLVTAAEVAAGLAASAPPPLASATA
jgi:hypothetical protein